MNRISLIPKKAVLLNFVFLTAFYLFAVSASASTTISTDINTEGTLTVTGAGASSITNFLGLGTISPSSLLTIKGTTTTATLGSELIIATADQNFSSDTTKWTGTGWTIGSNVITHTAGANALTLDNSALSSAPVSGNVYQITFTVVTTGAGTLTPNFGGAQVNGGGGIGHFVGTLTSQIQVITATNAGALTFTPNATWTGTIDNVSIKQITTTPPLIIIQNSNGSTGLEMRSGGAGLDNTFVGLYSGQAVTTAYQNSGFGRGALQTVTEGRKNAAFGAYDLNVNTTGYTNSAFGANVLQTNTTGYGNSAFGNGSMLWNVSGNNNSGAGKGTLYYNTTGSNNSALGNWAGYGVEYNSDINNSVLLGYMSGYGLKTGGDNNTLVGYQSGYNLTTGPFNIIIGSNVNAPSATVGQQLNIGNVLYGTGIYGGSSVSSSAVVTGNIGVSTTTPYAKLSIQGTDVASTTLSIRPVNSQTANILDVYNTAGVLNSVINSSGNLGIGTTTPTTKLHVSNGANATTTVSIGELGLTSSKACVNMNRSDGGPVSFYFNSSGTMVIETNYCK